MLHVDNVGQELEGVGAQGLPVHRVDGNCKGGSNPGVKNGVNATRAHGTGFPGGDNSIGFRDSVLGHKVVGRVSCHSGGASVDISFPEDHASAKMSPYVRVLSKCNAKSCVTNLVDGCTHVGCVEVAAGVHVPIFDRCLSFTCTCRYVIVCSIKTM